jgi:sugar O-acyltransferase (sialic acid O-acetyltransferase NeuD family)
MGWQGPLAIIGAGGTSQQIAEAVADVNDKEPTWDLVGFFDDDPAKHGATILGLTVLGPVLAAQEFSGRLIVGIAPSKACAQRREVVEALGLPADRFATIVHPSAYTSRSVRIGVGCAIMQNVVITQNTVLGDHVIVLQNVSIGHDVTIGNAVTIAGGAVVTGYSNVASACYLGARSAINNRVTVNEGAIVGLGAVVVKDVPAGAIVVGNPATLLPPKRQI